MKLSSCFLMVESKEMSPPPSYWGIPWWEGGLYSALETFLFLALKDFGATGGLARGLEATAEYAFSSSFLSFQANNLAFSFLFWLADFFLLLLGFCSLFFARMMTFRERDLSPLVQVSWDKDTVSPLSTISLCSLNNLEMSWDVTTAIMLHSIQFVASWVLQSNSNSCLTSNTPSHYKVERCVWLAVFIKRKHELIV